MAHTNPITTNVFDPTSDTNTNPRVSDTLLIQVPTSPMRPRFASETVTLHGERKTANDGESRADHDADELRSVILNYPGTPGILLRAYDDHRGRISTSREAIMNEQSERVVCGISIADSTATTDTPGSTSDTYGRWNIASQRGSLQPRTTRVRYPTDGRHDDVDTKRDDT